MNLLQRLRGEERSILPLDFNEWASWFTYNGNAYPFGLSSQTLTGNREEISNTFAGLAQGAYKSNGVVAACMYVRQALFSEARFQFQQMEKGRPGKLFGSEALKVLEEPWPGGTTGDFLTRAILDADLAGNFFCRRVGSRIMHLRPDWVTIVLGSRTLPDEAGFAADAEVVGYLYHPGGRHSGHEPDVIDSREVAHFAPKPDPMARYRGMSWLTPVLREIMADSATTDHKERFFTQGATPNMVVVLDKVLKPEDVNTWAARFREQHEGARNAFKTIFFGAGADVKVVGSSFKDIDFKATKGAGETIIAAAAEVPPIIVGLSEGLEAATYSNYGQARRRFADGTMRPLWRIMAGSLQTILPPPPGTRLWYDDRDIPFLQEDEKDAADIVQVQAAAIRTLTDGGYEPESVVQAVISGDLSFLEHTGLMPVQQQPAKAPAAKSDNGAGDEDAVPVPASA